MFDKAVAGLAAQGFEQSKDAYGGCAYRGEDGRKCAMGHCITDDQYLRINEGEAASKVIRDLGWYNAVRGGFADQLQYCHDEADHGSLDVPTAMKQALRALGERFGLTIPEVLLG